MAVLLDLQRCIDGVRLFFSKRKQNRQTEKKEKVISAQQHTPKR
jgi:hypothetical protein